jgi:hypothetical protein
MQFFYTLQRQRAQKHELSRMQSLVRAISETVNDMIPER